MAERLAENTRQALSEQDVVVPGTQVTGLVVPRLVQQLSTVRKQREELAREVEARVHAPPLCPVLISLPGVGIRTAARLLTEVVSRDFHSAAHLAAYAGLSSVTRRSGTSIDPVETPAQGLLPALRDGQTPLRLLRETGRQNSGTESRRR